MFDRVVTRLTKQGLYEDYCQVFFNQENEDIIERGILSQNSSIFHPLRLCTSVTVKGKILFNEM